MRISWIVFALAAARALGGCGVPYYAALLGGLNTGPQRPVNQPQNNGYQAMTPVNGSTNGAPPPVTAGAPPPVVQSAPRVQPRWRGGTAVRLVNRSAVAVCYVQMAPENESDQTGDWLAASEVVPPGATFEFRVQPAKYRVHFETCEHDVVLDETGMDFRGPRELHVLNPGVMGLGSSGNRIEVHTAARPRPRS